ncbi:hypothetical protein [Brachybacterium squillarum]|uniref:hypothetical protein n=1 Tax=Brachybacterium squillarum TaxID=661979 RepID=UPI0022220C07|nr:hypothetical protein [Brachybacterium squillarum]MCW1806293.1 hypothetical protein [Brachybacterium squillarum]
MSTEQASTSTRRWIGQAVTSLLLAGGVLMPYAPWLIPNGLARVIVMVALLAAGLLVYGIAIRRAELPRADAAPAPTASRLIIVGVVGLSVLSSLVIESIHAPLWFPLLVVVAALLLLAFRLDASPREPSRR